MNSYERVIAALQLKQPDRVPVMEFVIDAGVDAINPIEPVTCMDIGELKQKNGSWVCIIGNIDRGDLLNNKNPEDVEEAVKDCIRKAEPGGGYILATSNSVHSSVKPENLITIIRTTRKNGNYPLGL